MATTPENHQPASAAGNEATQPNTYRAAPAPTMPQAQPAQQAPAQQAPAQQTPLTQTPAPVADQLTTPLPHLAAASQGGAYPQPVQTAQPTTQYPQPAPHSYPAPAPQHQYPQAPVQAQAPVQTQAPMLSHGQAKPQQSQLGLGAFGLGVNDGHGNLSGHGGQGGDNGDGGGPGDQGGSHQAQPKSRTGLLLAGLAIGALLGGVVGGGVAAVVSANTSQQPVAQGTTGSLTLNNAETATAISGVAAVATPSVVTLEVAGASASGSGSGVIYNEDGYIITNAHVVTLDGAAAQDPTIRVKLSDGRILDGKLVDIDPYADLAVVKVDATGLPAIQIADSDSLNVGDLTVAIGAPLNLASTVTSGVVSSLYRGITVGSALIPQAPSTPQDESDGGSGMPWDFRFNTPDESAPQQEQPQQQTTGGAVTLPVIQTDASINPGNSGGALLNGKGELIGINVAIASPTSSNGVAGSDGLGFAIPANLASRVADSIIAGDQPSHGLLGASVADSTQDTDADANHAGGLLVEIIKGGSAEKAGLRAGDVITAVNGVPAVDGTSVSALVRMNAGGSTVTIDYTRGGVAGQTDAKLGTLEW